MHSEAPHLALTLFWICLLCGWSDLLLADRLYIELKLQSYAFRVDVVGVSH